MLNNFAQRFLCFWQARRDSNPQPPDLESGALPVRATGLRSYLLRLFVRSMYPAKRAIFIQLELARGIFLVFRRRVVTTLARAACKSNYISHIFTILLQKKITPLLNGTG